MELEYLLTCPQESTTFPLPKPDYNFYTIPNFFMMTLSTLGSISVSSYHLHLSSKQYLSFRFPCQNLVYISLLHTSCPAWLDHSNNTHWGVKIMKLHKTELFAHPTGTSSRFVPSVFLSILFLNTFCLCSFIKLWYQFSHPYKTTGKVTVLYISIVMFLVSKLEDKTFWTNW